jgi:hypothetical protein
MGPPESSSQPGRSSRASSSLARVTPRGLPIQLAQAAQSAHRNDLDRAPSTDEPRGKDDDYGANRGDEDTFDINPRNTEP